MSGDNFSAFYTLSDDTLTISPEQASGFAKTVAGDFNPIHDAGDRRFCVPGDLLFTVILENVGLYQHMSFTFDARMTADMIGILNDQQAGAGNITDKRSEKPIVNFQYDSEKINSNQLIHEFIKHYVAFSGQNFPYLLDPVLKSNDAMFNPKSPLVMYQSMDFTLNPQDETEISIDYVNADFDKQGKRGYITLNFNFNQNDEVIGNGKKLLLISGIRPYDESEMSKIIESFLERKNNF